MFKFFESSPSKKLLPLSQLPAHHPTSIQVKKLEKAVLATGYAKMDPSRFHEGLPYSQERLSEYWLYEQEEFSKEACRRVVEIIHSDSNKHGELYQYWFDHEKDAYPGNNILLLAISRGCHSLSDRFTYDVQTMVLAILQDAKEKLSPALFKQFLGYRFQSIRDRTDRYFDNTPLTLAINSGLLDVANWILDQNVLDPLQINIQCREGNSLNGEPTCAFLTAAHFASLRVNITHARSDLNLLLKLYRFGADFHLKDQLGHNVLNLATLDLPQFHARSIGRRTEKNSFYTHQMNYDARLMDVYQQPDQYNKVNLNVERHPERFAPYSKEEQLSAEDINVVLDSISDKLALEIIPDKIFSGFSIN